MKFWAQRVRFEDEAQHRGGSVRNELCSLLESLAYTIGVQAGRGYLPNMPQIPRRYRRTKFRIRHFYSSALSE